MSMTRMFRVYRIAICLSALPCLVQSNSKPHAHRVKDFTASAMRAKEETTIAAENSLKDSMFLNEIPYYADLDLKECLAPHQALIIHWAEWSTYNGSSGPHQLISSRWYAYHAARRSTKQPASRCELHQASIKADGTFRLYGDNSAVLLGVNIFVAAKGSPDNPSKIVYKGSATPGTPANIQNLAQLAGALVGYALPVASDSLLAQGKQVAYIATGRVNSDSEGLEHFPVTFNLGYSLTIPNPTDSNTPVPNPGGTPAPNPGGTHAPGAPGTPISPGAPPAVVPGIALPSAQVYTCYRQILRPPANVGVGSYGFAAKGLPAGLSVGPDGVIAGKSSNAVDATFDVELREMDFKQPIRDAAGKPIVQHYSISVLPGPTGGAPPAVVPAIQPLPQPRRGVYYRELLPLPAEVSACGATFLVPAPSGVPDGLQVTPGGVLEGTPTGQATGALVLQITDNQSARIEKGIYQFVSVGNFAPTAPGGGGGGGGNNNGNGAQAQNSGSTPAGVPVVDCSSVTKDSACNFSRTFSSDDKEWWDVSIGVTTPGIREPKFSSATTPASVTRHTELYGILDLLPFAPWWSKDSYAPRLNVGLPVSGKPFYMPYFGVSENLTGRWRNFPLQLNVFAGVIYLKENFNLTGPSGPATFKAGRELKGVFGIEVPLTSIISKVGGGSKSANGGGSGSGTGKGAGK